MKNRISDLLMFGFMTALIIFLASCNVGGVVAINNSDNDAPQNSSALLLSESEESNIFISLQSALSSFCALKKNGDVYCWGKGGSGLLGNESTVNSALPVKVSKPDNVVFKSLIGFNQNFCAIDSNGQVYCWGGGGNGQIGNGGNLNVSKPTRVSMPVAATSLSIGASTICAIGTDKNAYCWGSGDRGQIGNSTNKDTNTPTLVSMPSLKEKFTAINLAYYGDGFVCALGDKGNIYCWGNGSHGEIGNGFNYNESIPVQIKIPSGVSFKYLAQGMGNGQCALDTNGIMYCWGYNAHGEGGNGSKTNTNTPTKAKMPSSGESFSVIGSSVNTACAVSNLKNLYCWGYGENGEVGNHSESGSLYPVKTSASNINKISSAYYIDATFCGISAESKVYCWGYGDYGQIGNNQSKSANTPTSIAMYDQNTKFVDVKVSGNSNTVCGLTSDGKIYCWGYGRDGGLGNGFWADSTIPTLVTFSPPIVKIAASKGNGNGSTFCAINYESRVYCWGYGKNGEIGNGKTESALIPTLALIPFENKIIDIVSSNMGSFCALNQNGKVLCWGVGTSGQLGNRTMQNSSLPQSVIIPESISFVKLVGSDQTFCGIEKKHASMYCWGYGIDGEIGDKYNRSESMPTKVYQSAGIEGFSTIVAVGPNTFCALDDTSYDTYCWGYGLHGELASGSYKNSNIPLKISGFKFKSLYAADGTFCGIDDDSYTYCWGLGTYGQIGNMQNFSIDIPKEVVTINMSSPFLSSMATAGFSLCGLSRDESAVYCWGYGVDGQTGTESATNNTPRKISVPEGDMFKSIHGSEHTFCAVAFSGLIYCWGAGEYGQIGNELIKNASIPQQVSYKNASFASDVKIVDIVGAVDSFCSLSNTGHIYCWGRNQNGENASANTVNGLQPASIQFNY